MNIRYGLSIQNAKYILTKFDMENELGGKLQRRDGRDNFHLIRLERKNSDTYEKNISDQIDPQSTQYITTPPAVPGWRSVPHYFRGNTNNEVVNCLLKYEKLHHDAVKELDKQLGTVQDEDKGKNPALLLPNSKRPRIVESQARTEQ